MDLGMFFDRQIAAANAPRSAYTALHLPGAALDLDIPRTAHRQIQLIRIQPDIDPPASGIAYAHRRALEDIVGPDTARTRIR